MARSEAAARHAAYAARFADVVAGVRDWAAPTPVTEWAARDVVAHLTSWFPGFLAAGGVHLAAGDPDDPVGSWALQTLAVQDLLDDDDRASEPFTHPRVPPQPLGVTIDTFYTPDIFMHTWDLARASGADDTLDETTCADMLASMRSVAELIRGSGQYGEEQPVPDDATPQQKLIAFIGRDPFWRPGINRRPGETLA